MTNRMPALRLGNRPIQSAEGSWKRFSFFLVHRSMSLKPSQVLLGGAAAKKRPQRLGAVNIFIIIITYVHVRTIINAAATVDH